MELRQSTEVKVRIGPFVDVTNGYEPETGITLGAADEAEALKQNGVATVDISAATWAAVTGADGWYDLTLTASLTDTLGHLTIVVQDDSVCLPVFAHFEVVTANYYDSKYSTDYRHVDVIQISGDATAADNCELMFDGTGYAGGTTKLGVDTVAISGDTTAANNAELAFDGTGYGFTNCTVPTVTTLTGHTPQTGDSFARIGATGSGLTSLAQASVLGTMATSAATGDPTTGKTAMGYVKQLVNVLVGTAGIATFPAESAPGNGVSLSEVIRAIHADTTVIGSTGQGLTTLATAAELAKVPKSDGTSTWNATALASINGEVADVLTTDTIADSYSTDGNQPTIAQALLEVRQMMQEKSITDTTLTVKKPDGSTSAMTFTLNSATTPTSITRAT